MAGQVMALTCLAMAITETTGQQRLETPGTIMTSDECCGMNRHIDRSRFMSIRAPY